MALLYDDLNWSGKIYSEIKSLKVNEEVNNYNKRMGASILGISSILSQACFYTESYDLRTLGAGLMIPIFGSLFEIWKRNRDFPKLLEEISENEKKLEKALREEGVKN